MESIKTLYKIGYGPSSSHTMGPQRATEYFLQKYPQTKKLVVELYASLALTGKGHLTDYIIEKTAGAIPVEIKWCYEEAEHPNTLEFIGYDEHSQKIGCMRVHSVGGGDIQIVGEPIKMDAKVYPHHKFHDIAKFCQEQNISLLAYVDMYDTGIEPHLKAVWAVMKQSIIQGLKTEGVLNGELHVERKAKALIETKDDALKLLAYAYAVNEENASAKSQIVTAPTCGASGTLPAVLKYAQDTYGYSDEEIINALKIAGLIGVLIRKNASISGAVAGCQAEVGSATSMAAAALAFLAGEESEIIESAAEIAMEHQLGLTCDPVAGYVQIPCIQRNAVAAQKAYTAYRLAKTLGGRETVSFDTIVDVMYETGIAMPHAYRETSTGGIAVHYKNKQKNV